MVSIYVSRDYTCGFVVELLRRLDLKPSFSRFNLDAQSVTTYAPRPHHTHTDKLFLCVSVCLMRSPSKYIIIIITLRGHSVLAPQCGKQSAYVRRTHARARAFTRAPIHIVNDVERTFRLLLDLSARALQRAPSRQSRKHTQTVVLCARLVFVCVCAS